MKTSTSTAILLLTLTANILHSSVDAWTAEIAEEGENVYLRFTTNDSSTTSEIEFNKIKEWDKFYDCLCFKTNGPCKFEFYYNPHVGEPNHYHANVREDSDYDIEHSRNTVWCDAPRFPTNGTDRVNIDCTLNSHYNDDYQSCFPHTHIKSNNASCPCINIWWIQEQQQQQPSCPDIFEAEVVPCTPPEEADSDNSVIAIAAGAGCALGVIVAIVIVALCVIRRNRKRDLNKSHKDKDNGMDRAKANQYIHSTMVENSKRPTSATGGASGEGTDIYPYTDYIEPGSVYCIIGDDDVTVKDPDRNSSGAPMLPKRDHRKTGETGRNPDEKVKFGEGGATAPVEGDVLVTKNAVETEPSREEREPSKLQDYDLQKNMNADEDPDSIGCKVLSGKTNENGKTAKTCTDLGASSDEGKNGPREDPDSVEHSVQKDGGNSESGGETMKESEKANIEAASNISSGAALNYEMATGTFGGDEEKLHTRNGGYNLQKDTIEADEKMEPQANVYTRLRSGKAAEVPKDVMATYNVGSGEFEGAVKGHNSAENGRYSSQKDAGESENTDSETNIHSRLGDRKEAEVLKGVTATYNGVFEKGTDGKHNAGNEGYSLQENVDASGTSTASGDKAFGEVNYGSSELDGRNGQSKDVTDNSLRISSDPSNDYFILGDETEREEKDHEELTEDGYNFGKMD